MSVDSISHLDSCIETLNINRTAKNPNSKHQVKLLNQLNKKSGSMEMEFILNEHTGRGPYIELSDEAKSFGVMYHVFKPEYCDFSFNVQKMELQVKNSSEQFVMKFNA
jgi:hypothetical protein